jgi:O-antigen/teichoic acid export membrane protein
MQAGKVGSLKKLALHGVFWNAVGTFGSQFIQFAAGLFVARMLTPSDFGLLGMLTIFIAISQLLVDNGFGQALVRKSSPTQKDYSTVFFFNIGVSILLYLVLFFTSPLISGFYREPELDILTKVLAITIIINSLGLTQKTILTKKIDFKTQAVINLISISASSLLGIYLAVCGKGVWALVFQSIANNVLCVALYWTLSKWRPTMVFSINSFKSLSSFSFKLLLSGLIDTIYNQLTGIIIGKVFNAQSLGYYTKAKQIQGLPVTSITQVIQSVTYPLYSKIQEEDQRLKAGFQKTVRILAFIVLPMSALLILVAEPFVRLILTEKWLPSVKIIQLLCTFGWLYPFHALNLNILCIKGRSDLFLRLEIIKKIIVTMVITVTVPFGITAMIQGQLVCSVIAFFINSYFSGKMINYSWQMQIRDILPFFLASTAMLAGIYFITTDISNELTCIIVRLLLGSGSFLLLTAGFWSKALKLAFNRDKQL